MRFTGIIPARYGSTRFPGKPLAIISGKPMIQHVYERAGEALEQVLVATDDERIERCVQSFGGQVIMTSTTHQSGTDRCYEAATKAKFPIKDEDVIINIQGDEPFIQPEQIAQIKSCFHSEDIKLATLAKKINSEALLHNPNTVKVVTATNGNAIYFSRSAIPYCRDSKDGGWTQKHPYYKHIGMYAYRLGTLRQLCKLAPSSLELSESLEQLRWLENGYSIKVMLTEYESMGIDTPEDLEGVNG